MNTAVTQVNPSNQGTEFVYTTPDDPRAAPLIAALREEYLTRYHDLAAQYTGPNELDKYPAELFSPAAGGNFVLLLENGLTPA